MTPSFSPFLPTFALSLFLFIRFPPGVVDFADLKIEPCLTRGRDGGRGEGEVDGTIRKSGGRTAARGRELSVRRSSSLRPSAKVIDGGVGLFC